MGRSSNILSTSFAGVCKVTNRVRSSVPAFPLPTWADEELQLKTCDSDSSVLEQTGHAAEWL